MAATNPRFSDLATAHILRRLTAESTAQRYRYLADLASQCLGSVRVHDITENHVRECVAWHDSLAPSTRSALLSFVRSVLKDAGNTSASRVRVRVPRRDRVVLDRAQSDRLRDQLWRLRTDAARVLCIILETGLRLNEALALREGDWQADARQLVVRRGKGGRARRVDVSDWLADRLNANGLPGRVLERTVRRHLALACAEAGLPQVRVHDLRHGRITRLLLAGVPVLYVSQQAGHESVSFTLSRYGHVAMASEDDRRSWANA